MCGILIFFSSHDILIAIRQCTRVLLTEMIPRAGVVMSLEGSIHARIDTDLKQRKNRRRSPVLKELGGGESRTTLLYDTTSTS